MPAPQNTPQDQNTDSVGQKFAGLPMDELIAAPLTAACDSQMKLAAATYEYINKIGFEDPEKQDGSRKARLVEFDLERPAETPSGYESVKTHVQAPLLGLVPIPSLLVEDVNIEFQMEVSAATTEKTNTAKEASSDTAISGRYLFASASTKICGKLSSSRENTRSTNQSAKYQVRVAARQQQPTEGLARLMDILAECTAALPNPDKNVSG